MKCGSNKQNQRIIGAACAALAMAGVMGTSVARADLFPTSVVSSAYNVTFSNITQTVDASYTALSAQGQPSVHSGTSSYEPFYGSPPGATGPSANFPVIYHGAIAEFPSAGTITSLRFQNLNNDLGGANTGSVYQVSSDGQTIESATVHVTLAFDLTYPAPQAMPTIKAFEFGGGAYRDPGAVVTPMSGTLKITAKPNNVLSAYTASSALSQTISFDAFHTATDWTASATTSDAGDTGALASVFHIVYDTTLEVTSPPGSDFLNAEIDKGDVAFAVPTYVPPPNGGGPGAPEPATIGLLGVGSVLLMSRRRSKR